MKQFRILEQKLINHFKHYKQALLLLGARQVGKTTLLRRLFPNALYLLVDEKPIQDILETYSSNNYKTLIRNHKQVLIDEIHLLSNPGRAAKIIYDQFPGIQLIVTGSSSLHIKNKTAESMAGRTIDYFLYPLTFWEFLYQQEIEQEKTPRFITDKILKLDDSKTIVPYAIKNLLFETLSYGLYPETLNLTSKETYLKNLASKVIFKDLIELDLIENREKALTLLQLLAYQIGNLINYAELSRRLGLSIPTIQRYISIFEQSFIIFRVLPFVRNKRTEITKAPKIYFWDIGLRNALIDEFNNVQIRGDQGALFENFIISEVKKEVYYRDLPYKINYWRMKSGAEVDLVLSNRNEIFGVEIKTNKQYITKSFVHKYPNAKTMVINMENFF